MSNPPTQAQEDSPVDASQPRHRARKRRKHNHTKDSIYLASTVEPYKQAIKWREPSQPEPSGYAPIDEAGAVIEGPQTQAEPTFEEGHKKGKGKKRREGENDKDPRYIERALKAWETKRQRQKERFETLEASSSLLALGGESQILVDGRDDTSSNGQGLSMPDLDPLLDSDLSDIPDIPKDDMLQSLQSYSSRYYTANNLLLEPYKRIRRTARDVADERRSQSRAATPAGAIDPAVPDEDSGSEYGVDKKAASKVADDEEEGTDDEARDESEPILSTIAEARKRGGQRGKRKLRDMYLALDGSALLTLGILIQEQIINRLQQEGYVPAHTLYEDELEESQSDQPAGGIENAYEVSDYESEEGNDDLHD